MSQGGTYGRNSSVPSNVAQAYVTNNGTAIPLNNILTVVGGNGLTTTATGASNSTLVISALNPGAFISLSDDFIGWFEPGFAYSQLTWDASGWLPAASLATNPGVIGSASGSNYLIMNYPATQPYQIILGGGVVNVNWVINLATLSNGTNRYTLNCGLSTATDGVSAISDGVYFSYSDNVNAGNWLGVTTSSSVSSTANSGIAALSNTYVNLGLSISANASTASFYINNVQIANSPLSTNIPTVALSPFLGIKNSVGTAPTNACLVDLFYMTNLLTTPR